jgi:hypothetical protein
MIIAWCDVEDRVIATETFDLTSNEWMQFIVRPLVEIINAYDDAIYITMELVR